MNTIDKIKVMMCDLTHFNSVLASENIPLGVGMLSAYAQKQLGSKFVFDLYKEPSSLGQDLEKFDPHIVGLSNYLWNQRLSLTFARHLKETRPNIITIFGGPNYPVDKVEQEEFLTAHPEIDFYLPHDAEISFTNLLKLIRENEMSTELIKEGDPPDGVDYIHRGKFISGKISPRAKVSDIPSPYLLGMFDKFLSRHWEPLIITARGCPFQCTFCVEGQDYYTKVYPRDIEEVKEELAYIAKKLEGTEARLNIADSNFGMYKANIEVAKAIEKCRNTYGWPSYVTITGGKNKKERVLESVKYLGKRTSMTLSIQSSDADVLDAIGRTNVSLDTLVETSKELEHMEMGSYSEVILALPLDTKERFLKSIRDLITARIKKVVVFTLMILPGAKLGSIEDRKKYRYIMNYRTLPRSCGKYQWDNTTYAITEVEQVAVGNESLTKEDYLFCRSFSLTLTMFYNGMILRPLHNFLQSQGLSIYDFIYHLHSNLEHAPKDLIELYAELMNDIEAELFETEKDILEHFQSNLEGYLNEDLGMNIYHKTMSEAWLNHFESTIDFAFREAKKFLDIKNGTVSKQVEQFLDEMNQFVLMRAQHLMESGKVLHRQFTFDPNQLESGKLTDNGLINREPTKVVFRHTVSQRKFIEARVLEGGNSKAGIGRVLTSTNVEELFRNAYDENSGVELSTASQF